MIKIIVLALYLLDAMTAWIPKTKHSYYEKVSATEDRYIDLAFAIAKVALDPNQEPLFDENDGRIKTALLLASIASYESQFNERVTNCYQPGDHGLAWGPFQTHSNRKKTCSSFENATIIALGMARQSIKACKNFPILDRLSAYTNGHCVNNFASQQRMSRGLKWYAAHQPETIEIDEGTDEGDK